MKTAISNICPDSSHRSHEIQIQEMCCVCNQVSSQDDVTNVNLATCTGNAVRTWNCESSIFLRTEEEETGGLPSGRPKYEVCPESKDTKVLNMYNIFNLQKPHCQSIACT